MLDGITTREYDMTTTTSIGDRLLGAAQRLTRLLGEVSDGTAIARPTTWTIAETAAHVLAELSDHAELAEQGVKPELDEGPAWKRGRQANALQQQRFAERDLHLLAPQLVPAARRAIDALSRTD